MSPDVALEPRLRALYPFCRLTGPANVLLMPGLHSAHITSRLLPRLGGGSTIGPLLIGLTKPRRSCRWIARSARSWTWRASPRTGGGTAGGRALGSPPQPRMQSTSTAAALRHGRAAEWSPQRRNLAGACLAHMLHDGYTDQLYALLPVWQSEFGLSYAGLAVVRALYYGTMGGLQVPGNRLIAQARSTHGADAGDFRRGSGISGNGHSMRISGSLHWPGCRRHRVERAAPARFAPGHEHLRESLTRAARHLQFRRRSRESDLPRGGRPAAAGLGMAAGGRHSCPSLG